MRITVSLASTFAALSLFGALTSLSQAAQAESEGAASPDGQFSLTGGSIAAGIGYRWGAGQLDFEDAAHTVNVSGLSIIDVGAAKIDPRGSVYHLEKLSDFNGAYTTFAAGATIAGGEGVAYLRSQNSVVIRLDSTTEGLRFNLSASGVTLKVES